MFVHISIADLMESGKAATSCTLVSTPLQLFFGEHIPAVIPFHLHLQSH